MTVGWGVGCWRGIGDSAGGWMAVADRRGERFRRVEPRFVLQSEERFLSARADHFAGAKWEEKASACFVRNDGGLVWVWVRVTG
jgi:hypothetical protein